MKPQEVRRRILATSVESIDYMTGGHISMEHVGKSFDELQKRAARLSDGEASSFYSIKGAERAWEMLAEDEYAMKMIAKKFDADIFGVEEILVECDTEIGVVVNINGVVARTNCAVIVIEYKGGRINQLTGLPFEVKTIYLEA